MPKALQDIPRFIFSVNLSLMYRLIPNSLLPGIIFCRNFLP